MSNETREASEKALDEIISNRIMLCVRCGRPITKENYSGWEAFTADGKTTQPICWPCDLAESERVITKESIE